MVPPSFAAGEGSSTEVARPKPFQQPVGKQDSKLHLQATTLCRLSSLGRRAQAHQHSDRGRRSDGAIGTFLQRRCRVVLGSVGRAGGHQVPRGQQPAHVQDLTCALPSTAPSQRAPGAHGEPRHLCMVQAAFGAQSPFEVVPAPHGLTMARLADARSHFAVCCPASSRGTERAPALSWETGRCWHRAG